MATNVTLYANQDGHMYAGTDDHFSNARDAASADAKDVSSDTMRIGLAYNDTDKYRFFRLYLYFDTSGVPANATVSAASIRLYLTGSLTIKSGGIEVILQSGQPDHPSATLTEGDFDRDDYSGDGGSFIAYTGSSGFQTLTLDSAIRTSWINGGGITKLCLRTDGDIDGDIPVAQLLADFYTSEKGTNYKPELTLTYTAPPVVTTQAATDVEWSSATGNGNITDIGAASVTQHGMIWKKGSDPVNLAGADGYTQEGAATAGAFTSDITGLDHVFTYYFRSYATNADGTSYGAPLTFETPAINAEIAGLVTISLIVEGTTEDAQQSWSYEGALNLVLTNTADVQMLYVYSPEMILGLSPNATVSQVQVYEGAVTITIDPTAAEYYIGWACFGNVPLVMTISALSDWYHVYRFDGNIPLTLTPNGTANEVQVYAGDVSFSLTPEGASSFTDVLTGTMKVWTEWKVEIDYNDGTTADISNRVYAIKIAGNLGDGDEKITISIRNHIDWRDEGLNLDPLDEASILNQDSSGAYDPLLLGRHEVRVYLKYRTEVDWALRWQGFAMSAFCVHVATLNDTITFNPYGITHIYKADQRLSQWDYRDRTLNSMLPSILLDSGFKGDRGHVIIQDDPAKAVDTFVSEEDSAWDVMQAAVEETGYILASRYAAAGTAFNDGSGLSTSAEGYFLTLYDPIRVAGASTWDVATAYAIGQRVYYSGVVYHCLADNTGKQPPNSTYWEVGVSSATDLVATQRPVDATFDQEFSARRIDANLNDVRTLIQVVYQDRDTTDGERKSVTVWSDSSRLRHGIPAGDGTKLHVKMRLAEQRGTNIDSEPEATDFAYASLHDLQEPSPDGKVTLPYFYTYVKMHEWYRFVEDDYTIDLGITGYTLTVTADNPIGKTTFKGTIDRVIGRVSSLLEKDMTQETRWTRRLDFLMGAPEALPQPTGVTVKAYPINSQMSEIRISWDQCNAWWFDHTEVWLSRGTETRYGADPVSITTKNHVVIGPYPVNETYYARVRHMPWKRISQSGNSS